MTLKEYQDILYGILCVVDDICRKNDVPYMLYGGTMLGAVRHHDFIPWDDDIDILIWKKECPRLCARLKEELPQHMRLLQPEDLLPNFYDLMIRVQDLRHPIHEWDEEGSFYGNKLNYACIDIFQLSYSGNTAWSVKSTILSRKILWGLAMGHRFRNKSENFTLLQKMQSNILSFIGKGISMETNLRWMEYFAKRQDRGRKKYCMAVNSSPVGLDWIYESAWYDGIVYQEFRNRQLPVPKEFDKHLTSQYGDYMTPVKDEKIYIRHFYGKE